jgi:hypothetical protein
MSETTTREELEHQAAMLGCNDCEGWTTEELEQFVASFEDKGK